MDIMQAIKTRRSVRTFDSMTLAADDAKQIIECAKSAKNPYGMDVEFRLLDAKKDGLSSVVINGTDSFIAGKMTRAAHAEEAFGYTFEQVVLFAQTLGVGTTWIAGTMDRAAFERAMDLREGEVMPCVSPLGYPAKKMSVRETMMRKGIKADTRFAFEEVFFDETFNQPLAKEKAGRLEDALEAIRLAPSAVNKQPWRVVVCGNKVHFFEKKNVGFDDNKWDIQKVDMGIALCHFEMGAKQSGLNPVFEIQDPGLSLPENTRYIASFVL